MTSTDTGRTAGDSRAGDPAPGKVLAVSCIALATVVAAVASLNVALPSIAEETHATQTQLSWIVDAYALVFAALLLCGGTLGDRYGRRRALLAGLAVFGAASIAAMCSSSAAWLIAMRAVLGLGAALVMPATLSTVTSTFPQANRSRAVGTWAGVAGASAVLGLLTSGLVLEVWSWRAVFAVNVVLSVVAITATLRVVPESARLENRSVDWMGAVLTVLGLGALVYAIIEAPTEGWTSPRTLVTGVAGLLVLAAFVGWELRTADPLLDPRLFRHAGFTAGTVTITVQFFAFFGFIFLLLQYLQLVLTDSPLVAAVSLVPMALGMMPTARLAAPRLAERAGAAPTSAAGLLIVAASLVWLSRLDSTSSYWPLLGGLVPLGIGAGLSMTPATTAITEALPQDEQGVGSAVNDLARELGGALGIAVLGSVLQSTYRDRVELHGVPHQIAAQARESLALADRLGGSIAIHARDAFADGMQFALVGAAAAVAIVALCIGVIAVVGRRR